MNPVSNTAYYCCGVRMEDAAMADSLCNDHFAKRFMDEHGLRIFEPFRSETMPNISCATRCRIIDDMLRAALHANAQTTVITIGAGFDTRPYRLQGGRWFEIDEAPLINLKNARLPVAECPNALIRIAIDFAEERLGDKLAGIGNDQAVAIVIEGVMMYLESEAIRETLRQLQHQFPRHTLICDLMNKPFADLTRGSFYQKIVVLGARFAPLMQDPLRLLLDSHYAEVEHVPNYDRASQLGALWRRAKIPRPVAWLLGQVLLRALNGYGVHRLEFGHRTRQDT